MTIFVTGATGHLGRLIINDLLERGVAPGAIVAGGRSEQKLAEFADRGTATAVIDYSDEKSLETAFQGVETLMFVSASEPGARMSQHTAVVEAAKAAGVARIVYTSAPKADTSPLILAPDHKATEALIRESGIPFTFLRNGWYTENYLGALDQAKQSGSLLTSAGAGRVASASRSDYAEAAAVVLTTEGHENRVYELAGDVAWSFEDLAAAMAEVAATPISLHNVSPEEHLEILKGAGLDEGTAGFVVALEGNTRDGLLAGSNGDLRGLIGHPTVSLRDGLALAGDSATA